MRRQYEHILFDAGFQPTQMYTIFNRGDAFNFRRNVSDHIGKPFVRGFLENLGVYNSWMEEEEDENDDDDDEDDHNQDAEDE
jgi:hypothetical protein